MNCISKTPCGTFEVLIPIANVICNFGTYTSKSLAIKKRDAAKKLQMRAQNGSMMPHTIMCEIMRVACKDVRNIQPIGQKCRAELRVGSNRFCGPCRCFVKEAQCDLQELQKAMLLHISENL